LATAIFIACREAGVPPTLQDIATLSNVIRKFIAKSQRSDELNLRLPTARVATRPI
jgi:transcription initiation factor TFIIIB Brf1 subunit/transcription initiation factor TFIIB